MDDLFEEALRLADAEGEYPLKYRVVMSGNSITVIRIKTPDGRFAYQPTNDSTPHQFELEFDDAP